MRGSDGAAAPGGVDPEIAIAALELEPSGVAVISGAALRVELANPAFRAIVPTSLRDPVGRAVDEVWPGEVGGRMRAIASRVLETGRAALHERYVHAGDDGVERVFAFHVSLLPLRAGPALLLVVWDTSDVEEARRDAERARERAELVAAMAGELSAGAALDDVFRTALVRATSLLGAADGALWLVDGEWMTGLLEVRALGRAGARLRLADHPHAERAARLLAPVLFARGDAEGDEPQWLARSDAAGALVAPIVERGRTTGFLVLTFRESGRWPRPEDVDFAEAIAAQCSLAIARARVYESERQARARAEAAETEAKRIGDLQERLAAVVGHDLRTPLAAIRLSTELLTRRSTDPATLRAAGRITASASRMDAIVADLLDFARARGAGGIPVSLAPARLDEIARQAAQELEAATGRAVRVEASGDCGLRGDASRLGQVVSNLVGNALDHGTEGSEVRVAVRGEAGAVSLEVHNDGDPIPPELLPALFEPFRRGTRLRNADGAGSHLGLGLFIVAEIARAHGGEATVRSAAGQGTTFAVTLPRDR